jgi:hypothetical protein
MLLDLCPTIREVAVEEEAAVEDVLVKTLKVINKELVAVNMKEAVLKEFVKASQASATITPRCL